MSRRKKDRRIGLIAWILIILAIMTTFFNILDPMADPMWMVYAFGLVFGLAAAGALDVRPDFSKDARQFNVVIFGIMGGAVLVMMQYIVQVASTVLFLATDPALALLAPVSEELLFTLVIYGTLRVVMPDLNWAYAAVPASVIFAGFHFFAYGVHPIMLPVLFMGSMILKWTYEQTGDIGTPMLAHAINNLMPFIAGLSILIAEYWYVPVALAGLYLVTYLFGGKK